MEEYHPGDIAKYPDRRYPHYVVIVSPEEAIARNESLQGSSAQYFCRTLDGRHYSELREGYGLVSAPDKELDFLNGTPNPTNQRTLRNLEDHLRENKRPSND